MKNENPFKKFALIVAQGASYYDDGGDFCVYCHAEMPSDNEAFSFHKEKHNSGCETLEAREALGEEWIAYADKREAEEREKAEQKKKQK